MRDLANQDFSGQSVLNSPISPPKGKILIPRGVVKILIILAIVLLILVLARNLLSGGSLIGGSSVVLRDAPKGLTPVMLTTNSNLADDALNLAIESASFTNVSDQGGSATATRKYGDGSFTMTVNASLPDPKGDTYQVWIVGANILKLAGTLEGPPGNMSLIFNDVDNYSDTRQVWITRERTSSEGEPELHILEGSF